MRTTSQRTGGKRRDDVSSVEIDGNPRASDIDQYSAPMKRGVLPIVRWIFRAVNEDDAIFIAAVSHYAAMGSVPRFVQHLDFAGFDMNSFDPIAIKIAAGRVGSDIVDNPLRIGRPNANVS